MQKIKYEDEEEFDFRREFELEQKLEEPKSLSKFKDILNASIDLNKKKKNQLKGYEKRTINYEQDAINQEQLEFVYEQTDEVLTYQKYLKTKLDEVLKAKLLTDRKINFFQDHLRHIKTQPDHVQREIDDRVKFMLKKTQYQAKQFSKQMDKFRSQSEQNYQKQTREIGDCEQSVKEIQQKIKRYKQKNEDLLQQIAFLSEQEEQKKIKLQECFRVSEYIEFFIDVKQKIVDKVNDEQSDQNVENQNQPQVKHLTRDEIINFVDQFYKTQDVSKLTEQILNTYNYLIEHQNMQTNEYDFYTEEKTLRQQQIIQLDQELHDLKKITNFDQEDQQDFGSFNNTIIEGPQVFHENYQLNYHLKGYQLNLITIYEKLLDMNQRLCNNLIWLSETTKQIPKSLDNKCMQYLKTFTKNDLNLYVPLATQSIPLNKSTSQKHFGQFISVAKRNGSITSEEIIMSEQQIKSQQKISYEKLNKFQQHKDYEIIQQQWANLIKNDLIFQQFQLEACFDNVDATLPTHQIVCLMYEIYFKTIKEHDLIKPYQIQFSYYKDVMRHIYKNNLSHSQKASTLKQKFVYEVTSPFLQQTKQIQLKRLQELSNSTNYDDDVGHRMNSTRTQNTGDDGKYHEYFIHQSTKIKKQFPVLQDQLLSKTLQDIDVMKQKEINENYQQSDQISSDFDYLNQERRNLKGILSKQKSKPQTADTTKQKASSRNNSNQKNRIIKQVQLLEKINKLSSSSRNLDYNNSFNTDLNKYTEKVQRKISDYFNSDLDFAQKDESRIMHRPNQFEKTLSASKSVEPYPITPISEQLISFERDSLRQIQESTSLLSGKKEKKFLIKKK